MYLSTDTNFVLQRTPEHWNCALWDLTHARLMKTEHQIKLSSTLFTTIELDMTFKETLLPARASCTARAAIFRITFATNFARSFGHVVRHFVWNTIAKHCGFVQSSSQSLLRFCRLRWVAGSQRLGPKKRQWATFCRCHSGFGPPDPNPLADMDPPSRIWTPLNNCYFKLCFLLTQ